MTISNSLLMKLTLCRETICWDDYLEDIDTEQITIDFLEDFLEEHVAGTPPVRWNPTQGTPAVPTNMAHNLVRRIVLIVHPFFNILPIII